MRILQVVPSFYPAWAFGGVARVVYEISRELARRGHEVTVHTTNALDFRTDFKVGKREYYVDSVRVRYFRNLFRLRGLFLSLNMVQGSKNDVRNSDVIHLHGFRHFQNTIVYLYSRTFRKPYVLTAHGALPRIIEKLVLKKMYDEVLGYKILNNAHLLIASSNIEKEQYSHLGISGKKIAIIPNGIDTGLFEARFKHGTFKKKLGLDRDVDLILYVGRVHKRKGLGFLLDAFARLKDTKAVLVIAGPDEGYVSVMKEKTSRLGIDERVIFTGFISEEEKSTAYVDSEVVVYPGVYESFPIVPLEAALCSKPVVVSDDSVMAEIVTQGGFGLSIRHGNVLQLRDALLSILNDPRAANEMGRRGKDFVKMNYNWRDIVSKLEHVYSEVRAS